MSLGVVFLLLLASILGGVALTVAVNSPAVGNAASGVVHYTTSQLAALKSTFNAKATASIAASPFGELQAILTSGRMSDAALASGVAPFLGPYASQANSVTPAEWSAVLALVVKGDTQPILQLADFSGLQGIITIGGLVAVAAVCAATAGLGCLVALVVVALIVIIVNDICGISEFFGSHYGCQQNNAAQLAANSLSKEIIAGYGEAADVAAVGQTNLINALNSTYVALGYEAASASLADLNYSSFPYNLVEVQSGIAAQMGDQMWADGLTLASIVAKTMADASYYEGTGDTSGYAAQVNFGADGYAGGFSGNLPQGVACPVWTGGSTSGSGTLTVCAYGAVFPTTFYATLNGATTADAYYIANGSTLNLQNLGGATTLELIPIAPDTAWVNVSVPAVTFDTNYTLVLPAGGQNGMGYYLHTGGVLQLTITNTWALGNAATFASYGQIVPLLTWVNDNPLPTNGLGVAGGLNFIGYCVGYGGPCSGPFAGDTYGASILGGNNATTDAGGYYATPIGAGAQDNLGTYLDHLVSLGMTMGDAYWAFLHYSLGYTSESQVPANCIVPSPEQVLPPNIPVSTLLGLNLSSMLDLYQASLFHLAQVFNASESLTNVNICGQHAKWNTTGGSIPFGVYASGYIFINGTHVRNSNGTVAQNLAVPQTWNISGTFYLAPTVANLGTLHTNETYVLPSLNPVVAFATPYLIQDNGTAAVNPLGPLDCPFAIGNVSGSCYQNPLYGQTVEVTGNSTSGGGYTASLLSGASHLIGKGAAVYLTECYVAVNGSSASNPTYVTSNSCVFDEQRLAATGWTCNGTVLYYGGVAIGSCAPNTGPILVGGSNGCGGIWLSWLAGPIANSLAVLGPYACDTAIVITLIVLIVIVIVAAWLIVRGIRFARGG